MEPVLLAIACFYLEADVLCPCYVVQIVPKPLGRLIGALELCLELLNPRFIWTCHFVGSVASANFGGDCDIVGLELVIELVTG